MNDRTAQISMVYSMTLYGLSLDILLSDGLSPIPHHISRYPHAGHHCRIPRVILRHSATIVGMTHDLVFKKPRVLTWDNFFLPEYI
jgi:hypothetical protein